MAESPSTEKKAKRRKQHHSIYLLKDPRDGAVRYVGRTRSPKSRLSQHVSKPGNKGLREWIGGLVDAGLAPIMDVVDTVTGSRNEAAEMEKFWYARCSRLGFDMLNEHQFRIYTPGEFGTYYMDTNDEFSPLPRTIASLRVSQGYHVDELAGLCGCTPLEVVEAESLDVVGLTESRQRILDFFGYDFGYCIIISKRKD